MMASPAPAPAGGGGALRELRLLYHAGHGDHLLTATAEGEREAVDSGYTRVRVVGQVYAQQEEGTVPLVQWYSRDRRDHALLSTQEGARHAQQQGYKRLRGEGWARPFLSAASQQHQAGCNVWAAPLTTYWSASRQDTIGVADPATAAEVVEAGTYVLRRIEAVILDCPSPAARCVSPESAQHWPIRSRSPRSPSPGRGAGAPGLPPPAASPSRGPGSPGVGVPVHIDAVGYDTTGDGRIDALDANVDGRAVQFRVDAAAAPPRYSLASGGSGAGDGENSRPPRYSLHTAASPCAAPGQAADSWTPQVAPLAPPGCPSIVLAGAEGTARDLFVPGGDLKARTLSHVSEADTTAGTVVDGTTSSPQGTDPQRLDVTGKTGDAALATTRKKKPKAKRLEESVLRNLDDFAADEQAAMARSAQVIQRKYRGHRTQQRFREMREKLMEKVIGMTEKQRLQTKLQSVDAALRSLNEALVIFGVDSDALAACRKEAFEIQKKYENVGEAVLERREEQRKRIAKLRGIASLAGSGGDEAAPPSCWERVKNQVTAVIEALGLSGGQQMEDMGDQQNQWDTEPVFKAISDGSLPGLQKALADDPRKVRKLDDLGASILCISLLREKRDIAEWLIENHRGLASQAYTTEPFKGEIPLHFAIVKRDMDMALRLLEANPDGLLMRADGVFFAEPTNGCYWGEYPLFFAVCTNQPDMVLELLHFAEKELKKSRHDMLDLRDKFNNTVLHLCVWHNLPSMYEFIEKLCMMQPQPEFYSAGLQHCYNEDNLTPFTLAAKQGELEIFDHLLKRNTQETWNYGPHKLCNVFIDEIEPISSGEDVGDEKETVLKLLVEEQHKDLLFLDLIRAFMKVKWDKYIKRVFYYRLSQVTLATIAFIVSECGDSSPRCQEEWGALKAWIYWWPDSWFPDLAAVDMPDGAASWAAGAAGGKAYDLATLGFCECWTSIASLSVVAQRVCSVIVLTMASVKGQREAFEMAEAGVRGYFGGGGVMLAENICAFGVCSTIGVSTVSHFFGYTQLANVMSSMTALLFMGYHLLLMIGFPSVGPFIIMIMTMLAKDIVQFFTIFSIFLLGFAQSFHMLNRAPGESSGMLAFLSQMVKGFEVLLGEVDLERTFFNGQAEGGEDKAFPIVGYCFNVLYVVLVSILLVNLLIAMMSQTYSDIQAESEVVWNLEFSRLCLSLEGELDSEQRASPECKYWTQVDGRRCYMLPFISPEFTPRDYSDQLKDKASWAKAAVHPLCPDNWKPPIKPREPPQQGVVDSAQTPAGGDDSGPLGLLGRKGSGLLSRTRTSYGGGVSEPRTPLVQPVDGWKQAHRSRQNSAKPVSHFD